MNRHRDANINRLIWRRSFSDKKKTLFKSASYVSEENMLGYFFMMFYSDEVIETMGRTGMQMDHTEGQLHLADCLPNLNLIFLRWNKSKARPVLNRGFWKKLISVAEAKIANGVSYIAGKKERFCFAYSKYFAIIKKYNITKNSRLVESNVINAYLKILVSLDHKSRKCFYSLYSFLSFHFSKYFQFIKKIATSQKSLLAMTGSARKVFLACLPARQAMTKKCQMTPLSPGLSRAIKNLTGSRKTGKGVIWVGLVLLLLLPTAAFAENVRYTSELVWRTDGTGDYSMPVIGANSRYTSLPVVVSKSLITSITATWIFEGEVGMEVSADGGAHFTPVVNGVPLIKDFTQGTNIRWRGAVGQKSVLSQVRVSYTDASGLEGTFGTPELSGFLYRKQFYIKGIDGQPLFNYQVNVKLGESEDILDTDSHCNGHVTRDFKDIRFTLADGRTLIPFCLENISGIAGKRVAEFVLKIPQIPVRGISLYVYYGQPSAQSLSDAKKVFDFYDDFKSEALNKDIWRESLSPGGSIEVNSAGLVLDAASILSKDFEFNGGVIEFSSTLQTGNEARLIIRQGDSQSGTDKSQVAYSSTYNGAQHCIAADDIVKANEPNAIAQSVSYDYRVKVLGDEITFERYARGFGEKQAVITYIDTNGLKAGFLGLKTAAITRGANATAFHWIRARKCVEPGPVIDTEQASDEEKVNVAFFDGVVLSPKGDLILAEGHKEGLYITPVTYAAFDARIISPGWEGQGARVDITADGGKNASSNCVNFGYYYASKGDFVEGKELKTRLILKNKDAFLKELNLQYAAGSIVVLAPNGGEILNTGIAKDIAWTAWDYDKTYPLRIELSLDGGKTYSLITDKADNTGAYFWKVPINADLFTTHAKIRVSDANDRAVFDASDADFAILPPGLDIKHYNAIIDSGGRASLTGQAVYGVPEAGDSRAAGSQAQAGAQFVGGEAGAIVESAPILERETQVVDLNDLMDTGERRRGKKLYDLLIKVSSNQTSSQAGSGQGLFDTGDIVLVVPHGHNWSETERNSFLIIQAYLTEKEVETIMAPETGEPSGKPGDSAPLPMKRIRSHRIDIEKLGLNKDDAGKKTFQAVQVILENSPLKTELIEEKSR